MDELVIEGERYVSTKQAARLTGYAKDYVGQLCREGRVPARHVGRSWYVQEAAIKQHRFGSDEAGAEKETEKTAQEMPQNNRRVVDATWSAPRYESEPIADPEPLGTEQETVSETPAKDMEQDENDHLQALSGVWRDWFADRAEAPELPQYSVDEAPVEAEETPVGESMSETEASDDDMLIPIHKTATQGSEGDSEPVRLQAVETDTGAATPKGDLAPRRSPEPREPVDSVQVRTQSEQMEPTQRPKVSRKNRSSASGYLKTALWILALAAIFAALVGTGHLTVLSKHVGILSQLSGHTVFNK